MTKIVSYQFRQKIFNFNSTLVECSDRGECINGKCYCDSGYTVADICNDICQCTCEFIKYVI